jgi:putative transferase (TIGR04331 family)
MANPPFVWDAKATSTGLSVLEQSNNELLRALKDLVNNFHGVERSAEYYDLVAGDWLMSFSHSVFAAWSEALAGAESYLPSPIPEIRDTHHFSTVFVTVDWYRHLSWAVEQQLLGQTVEKWSIAPASLGHENIKSKTFSSWLKQIIFTPNPEVLLISPDFKIPMQERIGLLLSWRGWVMSEDLWNSISNRSVCDWTWRKKQSTARRPYSSDFVSIARALMPLYVPCALLEGLEECRVAALSLNLPRPRKVFSGNALYCNLAFKLLFAEWRQDGSRLLYHQHGGGYGLELNNACEKYELRLADKFFSWGWQREGASIVPLSPAMPALKRNSFSDRTLLICVDLPRVPYRLMHTPMPGTIEVMHRNTCEFLTEFPNKMSLTVRPYPHDYGWGTLESMRAAAPEANFDSHNGIFSLYESSRLVVCSYLGTSWLEALGLNIPTVCFFDPTVYVFREDSSDLMVALKNVGILHYSGKDAARFIANLNDDPEGWWAQLDVQEARANFVSKYANFSTDWKAQWKMELRRAMDEE